MSSEHKFLFASLGDKKPLTARKVHIRRLYDLLQLCLQRNDLPRARRAWAILARCKEMDWKAMWITGVHILGEQSTDIFGNIQRLEFLRAVILQCSEDVSPPSPPLLHYVDVRLSQRETIIKELILRLIVCGKHREALDELEL